MDLAALPPSRIIAVARAMAPGSAFGEGGEGHRRLCFAQAPARMERAMHRLRAGL